MIGNRFGRLTVLSEAEPYIRSNGKPRKRWLCRCDCGNIKIILGENLTGGKTKSCGCLQKERTSIASTVHGDTNSRLYNVWCAMKRRCLNESAPEYKYYGARGITVCDEWLKSYEAFRSWAYSNGYDSNSKRGECTIDRIDVNGNYSPENCRWVDQKKQMNNYSKNHLLSYGGEVHSISEWSDILGIPYSKMNHYVSHKHMQIPEILLTI